MRFIPVILCAILFQVTYQRNVRERIKNGHDASIEDFPFVGLLSMGGYECTATLISSRHILTARHCLGKGIKPRRIVLGSDRRFKGIRFDFNESQESHHPGKFVDLAIIHLSEEVPISKTIKPVSLPTWSDAQLNITGSKAVMVGWGFMLDSKGGDKYPSILQAGTSTITHVDSERIRLVRNKEQKKVNAYTGKMDSGSPLIINQTIWGVLKGTVWDGKYEYENYYPVAKQLKWISEVTGIKIEK